ncbi:hypothetical protein ABR738_01690 [Streptomyces sp. Edi4]|uniref:hypothetical protein n=1 Tax=Streptomyces sp. Edi4 TaxID=3162527 RepID=UPI0033061257
METAGRGDEHGRPELRQPRFGRGGGVVLPARARQVAQTGGGKEGHDGLHAVEEVPAARSPRRTPSSVSACASEAT